MEQVSAPADPYTDLALAATSIFGGSSNEVYLKSISKTAIIKPATMKQLPLAIMFFRDLINNMDQESMAGLVELVAEKQQETIKNGGDPNKVSMEELSTVEMVHKAFGKVNLLTTLLSSALESLPKLAPAFTNLTEDEYGDLPAEEGMLIAGGIFMVNYGFFTKSLPPLLTAFMRSWASKNAPALIAASKRVMTRRK